jgi:hypothetical protein
MNHLKKDNLLNTKKLLYATPHIIYAYIRTNTNDKHSTNDLLRPKNLRFSSRTNHIKASCASFRKNLEQNKNYGNI